MRQILKEEVKESMWQYIITSKRTRSMVIGLLCQNSRILNKHEQTLYNMCSFQKRIERDKLFESLGHYPVVSRHNDMNEMEMQTKGHQIVKE